MLIHKDALIVHEITTSENSRYFLDGAFIDKQGRSVATDGHALVRFTSTPIDVEDFPQVDGIADVTTAGDVILSREDLKAALATVAKSGRGGTFDPQYLAIIPNGSHVTIATAALNRSVNIKARNIDAKFPAYELVLEAKHPVVATITLDPKYLEAVGRMARQIGAKAVTLTLHGEGQEVVDPTFFRAKGEHGTLDGAVMPMRP